MRKAVDFISDDKILDGKFKYQGIIHQLGEQADETVYFKDPKDKKIYQGFMLNCGFAVRKVGKK